MSDNPPANHNDDDMVWLEPVVFNMAADLNLPNTIPVGGFESQTCDSFVPDFVSDASQPSADPSVPVLSLTLPFAAGSVPPSLVPDVQALLDALHDYDQSLGGQGLTLDRSRSQATDTCLTVALRPNEPKRAWSRFKEMAEELGIPMTVTASELPRAPAPNGALAPAGPAATNSLFP